MLERQAMTLSAHLGFTLLLAACGACLPAQDQRRSLVDVVKRAEANGVQCGVVVLDAVNGRPRYQHRGKQGFIPASNQKLLTVAAVLAGLGPEYRFKTRFVVRKGVLQVHAGGDPNWRTGGRHDPKVIFARVAERLQKAGIQKLRGVRLSPGVFTGPIRPEGWPGDQLDRTYCAATGGLVVEAGCFRARVTPSAGRARIDLLSPPISWPVTGRVRVVEKKGARFGLADLGGRLRATGSIYRKSRPATVRGAVKNPAQVFEQYLLLTLVGGGITIDTDASAADMEVLTYTSELGETLAPVLRDSNNFVAEQLLRVLGAHKVKDGSFRGGLKALRRQLAGLLGELPAALRLADGSGLSRNNRVSPLLMAQLIRRIVESKHGRLCVASLARGGKSGTLRRRFKGQPFANRVLAKTGTLNGVSCLSGIVTDNEDRLLAFAILMNTSKRNLGRAMRRWQEQIVAAVAGEDRRGP